MYRIWCLRFNLIIIIKQEVFLLCQQCIFNFFLTTLMTKFRKLRRLCSPTVLLPSSDTTATVAAHLRPAVVALFTQLLEPDPNTGCWFTCKGCYFLSHSLEEMVSHVEEIHKPQDPVHCPYCKGSYKNKGSLQVHVSIKHRELHAKVAQNKKNKY